MDKQSQGHRINREKDEKPKLDLEKKNSEVSEIVKKIEKLNPEQKHIISQSLRAYKKEFFSGPIPHPEILKGYDDVMPGLGKIVVDMAVKEQDNRITNERKMIEAAISESKRGQYFGLSIAVMFLIAAVVLGINGHDWLAAILGGGTLVSLVLAFLSNRQTKSSDSKQ